jgi:hypothetical protein
MSVSGWGEVLCAWGWWDCPRSGVAMIDGEPYRFACEFSQALDDYPVAFKLWPIDRTQLEEELALWRRWVDWRSRVDSGQSPAPFEQQPDHEAFSKRLQSINTPPAVLAIPEWRLDPNRSFAGRVPKHFARWTPGQDSGHE